jgi:glucokinase
MVFLTFGTGLGAGIIADGRLISGANGNAGEVGHIRLADDGPIGYGKAGSFEGFCSGGGIAKLARSMASDALRLGAPLSFGKDEEEINSITTKSLAELAKSGNEDAIRVFDLSAARLGQGLSIIIDILNPEAIVIGSVYARSEELFRGAFEVIEKEALAQSRSVCKILPARLGDSIGDVAALAVAMEA